MNLFNKAFLKKVSIVLSVDIFSKILSFILLPIYLVLMPKIEFGEFTFIYITAITTSTLMSLNFYVVIIKDLSKEENILLNKKKFSTLFIFIFVFNILLLITSLFIEYNFKIISGFYGIELFKIEKVICILVIIILNVLSLFQYSLILSRKKTYEICFYILGKVIFSNLITIMLLKNVVTEYDTVLVRLFGVLIGEFIHIIFIQIIVRKSYLYFYLEVN